MKYLKYILILFPLVFNAQTALEPFKDKIDFYLLSEFIKMSKNDSVFASNSTIYKSNTSDEGFYYYTMEKPHQKIISDSYDVAYPFGGKLALVKKDGGFGLIDQTGEFIFDPLDKVQKVRLSSYENFVIFTEQDIYDLASGNSQTGYILCAEPMEPYYGVQNLKNGKYNLFDRKSNKPVFQEDVDSIILQNELIYDYQNDAIIIQKNKKYGVYSLKGKILKKPTYQKAKFIGEYILLFDGELWHYFTFNEKEDKLNFLISSEIECSMAAYQEDVIGVYSDGNEYNLLGINGKTLPQNYDYIYHDGSFGVLENKIVVFKSMDVNYVYFEITQK